MSQQAARVNVFDEYRLAVSQGRFDDFLQIHGGYGYMAEYEIGRAWADARVGRIYGGSSEVMREIIGRTL